MRIAIINFIFPVVFIFFTIFACEKDNGLTGNRENFYYEESYCADPWERSDSASDEELKERVSKYLKGTLDIDYFNFRVTHDGKTEICSSCSCTTGRIIRIEADQAYQNILLENGFKVE